MLAVISILTDNYVGMIILPHVFWVLSRGQPVNYLFDNTALTYLITSLFYGPTGHCKRVIKDA